MRTGRRAGAALRRHVTGSPADPRPRLGPFPRQDQPQGLGRACRVSNGPDEPSPRRTGSRRRHGLRSGSPGLPSPSAALPRPPPPRKAARAPAPLLAFRGSQQQPPCRDAAAAPRGAPSRSGAGRARKRRGGPAARPRHSAPQAPAASAGRGRPRPCAFLPVRVSAPGSGGTLWEGCGL